jgi:DNA polymerase
MLNVVGDDDDRARGLLQYYGANRTGRWSGRLIQMQNLPKNRLETLDHARELVAARNAAAVKYIYGNTADTLSQLIRTAFIPPDGHSFAVSDFSAIEARVIAWLAGEQWRLDVFRTHGKIYEASASAMFGVPIERIKRGEPEYALRQKGKVAELALGYQGAAGALIRMGALDMGLSEAELPDVVGRWRAANPRIVDLWHTLETAALTAIAKGVAGGPKGLIFKLESRAGLNRLTVQLPSGRKLYYVSPFMQPGTFGGEALWYYGQDQQTKRWCAIQTYGGKLAENVVQAIARDCLAEAILRLTAGGYRIVMHVHDEVIVEIPDDSAPYALDAINAVMAIPPVWAPDLPLKAEGFTAKHYKKD